MHRFLERSRSICVAACVVAVASCVQVASSAQARAPEDSPRASRPYPSARTLLEIPTVVDNPAVPRPSGNAFSPFVTARPDGRQLLVWRDWDARARSGSLYVSSRTAANQPWRARKRIGERVGSEITRLLTGPDGTTAVAWLEGSPVPAGITGASDTRVRLRVLPPRGARWSPAYTVGSARKPSRIENLQAVVGPNGDVTVAWLHSDACSQEESKTLVCTSLHARTLAQGARALGPSRALAQVQTDDIDITLSPDGSLTAGWANALDFFAARLPAGADGWSAATRVAPLDWLGASGTGRARLQANADGRVLYVWALAEIGASGPGHNDLSAVVFDPATGAWSPPVAIATTSGDLSYRPIVTLDAEGRFLVVAGEAKPGGHAALTAYSSANGVGWSRATVLDRLLPNDTFQFVATASGPPAILHATPSGRSARLKLVVRDGIGPSWERPLTLSRNAVVGFSQTVGGTLPYSAATSRDNTFVAAWETPLGIDSATTLHARTPARVLLRPRQAVGRRLTSRLTLAGRVRYLAIEVQSGFLRPNGHVVVTIDGRWRRHATVRNGHGTVMLPREIARGRHVASATFAGDRRTAPRRSKTIAFRVH